MKITDLGFTATLLQEQSSKARALLDKNSTMARDAVPFVSHWQGPSMHSSSRHSLLWMQLNLH